MFGLPFIRTSNSKSPGANNCAKKQHYLRPPDISNDVKHKLDRRNVNNDKSVHKFHCNICNYSASHKSAITKHILNHEKSSQKGYIRNNKGFACCHCKYKTDSEDEILRHLINQANNKEHFRTVNLESPTESETVPSLVGNPSETFPCEYCSLTFTNMERFEIHRQFMHSKDKVCTYCRKRFYDSGVLFKHMESHKMNDVTKNS